MRNSQNLEFSTGINVYQTTDLNKQMIKRKIINEKQTVLRKFVKNKIILFLKIIEKQFVQNIIRFI